ncbi:hypothetical protein RchiOBHm_Chr4g0389851 [Rosa chinensis]|uniref:Uncharacterized protein n=1 Tax=Rosa chinensis TaxID=74649 RepID=A0A2P6QQ42_ROSCH|nr:hypothetical protein RchiOBHm_Chr4g0389851 [Rosa chinensis]
MLGLANNVVTKVASVIHTTQETIAGELSLFAMSDKKSWKKFTLLLMSMLMTPLMTILFSSLLRTSLSVQPKLLTKLCWVPKCMWKT